MADENLKIPTEIEEDLVNALQKFSFWLHEQSDSSHILLDIKHISDAVIRCSTTMVAGSGAGFKLDIKAKRERDRQEFVKSDASKLADDAIARAINAAKKKKEDQG